MIEKKVEFQEQVQALFSAKVQEYAGSRGENFCRVLRLAIFLKEIHRLQPKALDSIEYRLLLDLTEAAIMTVGIMSEAKVEDVIAIADKILHDVYAEFTS